MLAVKSDPITFASESPAQYLVDVNANDLACLGATPRWMMVTALLPEGTTEDEVETHFRELRDACVRRGISLVGGHTEITFGLRRPILVGVLLGEVDADRLLRPGGARPGDRLLLTKAIAIEGTALVARELGERLRTELDPALVARAAHFLVDPGISVAGEAIALLDAGGITALHDPTEGGLATGVRELALAAGCGAVIDRDAVPVYPGDRCDRRRPRPRPARDACLRQPARRRPARRGGAAGRARPRRDADRRADGSEPASCCAAEGVEQELPAYDSDETTRVLGN